MSMASENHESNISATDAVGIRALRPDDREDMLAAVGRTGMQSLQRRFFAVKRGFSEKEIAFFMNVDFSGHARWLRWPMRTAGR